MENSIQSTNNQEGMKDELDEKEAFNGFLRISGKSLEIKLTKKWLKNNPKQAIVLIRKNGQEWLEMEDNYWDAWLMNEVLNTKNPVLLRWFHAYVKAQDRKYKQSVSWRNQNECMLHWKKKIIQHAPLKQEDPRWFAVWKRSLSEAVMEDLRDKKSYSVNKNKDLMNLKGLALVGSWEDIVKWIKDHHQVKPPAVVIKGKTRSEDVQDWIQTYGSDKSNVHEDIVDFLNTPEDQRSMEMVFSLAWSESVSELDFLFAKPTQNKEEENLKEEALEFLCASGLVHLSPLWIRAWLKKELSGPCMRAIDFNVNYKESEKVRDWKTNVSSIQWVYSFQSLVHNVVRHEVQKALTNDDPHSLQKIMNACQEFVYDKGLMDEGLEEWPSSWTQRWTIKKTKEDRKREAPSLKTMNLFELAIELNKPRCIAWALEHEGVEIKKQYKSLIKKPWVTVKETIKEGDLKDKVIWSRWVSDCGDQIQYDTNAGCISWVAKGLRKRVLGERYDTEKSLLEKVRNLQGQQDKTLPVKIMEDAPVSPGLFNAKLYEKKQWKFMTEKLTPVYVSWSDWKRQHDDIWSSIEKKWEAEANISKKVKKHQPIKA